MSLSVGNSSFSMKAEASTPETTTQKLEKATKGLGWTTVALLVLSLVTLFFCPIASSLLFGLAVVTAVSAGGTFIASLVTRAKEFFNNSDNKVNQVANNVNRFFQKPQAR